MRNARNARFRDHDLRRVVRREDAALEVEGGEMDARFGIGVLFQRLLPQGNRGVGLSQALLDFRQGHQRFTVVVVRPEAADLYPALLMGVVRAILLDRLESPAARPVSLLTVGANPNRPLPNLRKLNLCRCSLRNRRILLRRR